MDNLNNPDSLSSFNNLSKKELESILNRQGDLPKEHAMSPSKNIKRTIASLQSFGISEEQLKS